MPDYQAALRPEPLKIRAQRLLDQGDRLLRAGCCNRQGDEAHLSVLHQWEIACKWLLEEVTDRDDLRRLRGLRLRVSRVIVTHHSEHMTAPRRQGCKHCAMHCPSG